MRLLKMITMLKRFLCKHENRETFQRKSASIGGSDYVGNGIKVIEESEESEKELAEYEKYKIVCSKCTDCGSYFMGGFEGDIRLNHEEFYEFQRSSYDLCVKLNEILSCENGNDDYIKNSVPFYDDFIKMKLAKEDKS
jgi:hypothetical protein